MKVHQKWWMHVISVAKVINIKLLWLFAFSVIWSKQLTAQNISEFIKSIDDTYWCWCLCCFPTNTVMTNRMESDIEDTGKTLIINLELCAELLHRFKHKFNLQYTKSLCSSSYNMNKHVQTKQLEIQRETDTFRVE